jgi:hypothetical protein
MRGGNRFLEGGFLGGDYIPPFVLYCPSRTKKSERIAALCGVRLIALKR